MKFFIYGPPGSGKSTIGRRLADDLGRLFVDLDQQIEERAGMSIPEIFAGSGEAVFRKLETEMLEKVCSASHPAGVVALGGGALLSAENRELVEKSGIVVCLRATIGTLSKRLERDHIQRPLLGGNARQKLAGLLGAREQHYASFTRVLDVENVLPEELSRQIQIMSGNYHVAGMGQAYDVLIGSGGLSDLGVFLRTPGLDRPAVLVTDKNVGEHYSGPVLETLRAAGIRASEIRIEPGESNKHIETIVWMWESFAGAGLDRNGLIIALGGGVVGDMAGFAAATFLRGVDWVNIPTSLLAMVDSSLGGKTGANLSKGKNLIGAFHAPRLVVADPDVLATLPEGEWRAGMAETFKHGVISDPLLFDWCGQGLPEIKQRAEAVVRRAAAVKAWVITQDPYERGPRKVLNLGHTVGHGVELASGYRVSHGEAVAIGMVIETRFAERCGICQQGYSERLKKTLSMLELPTEIPADLNRAEIIRGMKMDKKRADGKVLFAISTGIGEAIPAVELANWEKMLLEV